MRRTVHSAAPPGRAGATDQGIGAIDVTSRTPADVPEHVEPGDMLVQQTRGWDDRAQGERRRRFVFPERVRCDLQFSPGTTLSL